MDGDGEDDPTDVPRLVAQLQENGYRKLVFAERTKRSESTTFKLFYGLYRFAHKLLTGIPVRVGNFSAVPVSVLRQLVVVSDLWNHYAASVIKARLPYESIPTVRASRLAGKSRMNFVALVIHGLSAISVFGDRVGVRLLIAVTLLAALAFAGLVATLSVRFLTNLAIPGWATYTSGVLFVILMQLLMLVVVFVFVVLGGRDSSSFLPTRDYPYFVDRLTRVFPHDESERDRD
jgi:hypothetical protein